jgi:hypothetical protein
LHATAGRNSGPAVCPNSIIIVALGLQCIAASDGFSRASGGASDAFFGFNNCGADGVFGTRAA